MKALAPSPIHQTMTPSKSEPCSDGRLRWNKGKQIEIDKSLKAFSFSSCMMAGVSRYSDFKHFLIRPNYT